MSAANHWMPLYVGDYLSDTAHLNTAQHGAYLLLLMHQWRTGSVPSDETQQARIARCGVKEWRRLAPDVLAMFEPSEGGNLINNRLERERQRSLTISQKRHDVATNAAKKRWKINDTPMLEACSEDAASKAKSCHPQPQPQSEDRVIPFGSNSRARRPRATPPEPKGFAEFWNHYPAKVGKAAARKAWPRAVAQAGGDPDEIIVALKARLHLFPDEERFIPNPSTWLNQGRWEDDFDTLFARSQRSA